MPYTKKIVNIFLITIFILVLSSNSIKAEQSVLSFKEISGSSSLKPGDPFTISMKIENNSNQDVSIDKCLFPIEPTTSLGVEPSFIIHQASVSANLYTLDARVPYNAIDFEFEEGVGKVLLNYVPLRPQDYFEMDITFGTTSTGDLSEKGIFNFDLNCIDTNQNTFVSDQISIQLLEDELNNTNSSFDDIVGTTFESHINELFEEGIINGYSDGLYHPERDVKRGAMAKFVKNAFEIETDTTSCNHFKDIDISHNFFEEITTLKCKGIISGFSEGTYKAEEGVTRAQVTKFISKALEYKGVQVDYTLTNNFPDVLENNTFYRFISYLTSVEFEGEKVIRGYSDGNYYPDRILDRGAMAKIVNISRKAVQVLPKGIPILSENPDLAYIDTNLYRLYYPKNLEQDNTYDKEIGLKFSNDNEGYKTGVIFTTSKGLEKKYAVYDNLDCSVYYQEVEPGMELLEYRKYSDQEDFGCYVKFRYLESTDPKIKYNVIKEQKSFYNKSNDSDIINVHTVFLVYYEQGNDPVIVNNLKDSMERFKVYI